VYIKSRKRGNRLIFSETIENHIGITELEKIENRSLTSFSALLQVSAVIAPVISELEKIENRLYLLDFLSRDELHSD
jgi:hypothetical protein